MFMTYMRDFETALGRIVADINGQKNMGTVTGSLATDMVSRRKKAMARSGSVKARSEAAMAGIESSLDQLDQVAQRDEQEAKELQSFLAQITNGPPE